MQRLVVPSQSGTYTLLIALNQAAGISVGKLGTYEFRPGTFCYIGSAHGPSGLAGRIKRHMRPASQKRRHWHIDWLLEHANIQQVWWVESPQSLECAWSQTLSRIAESPIPGFGSSDCGCESHLYTLRDVQHQRAVFRELQECQPEKVCCVSSEQDLLQEKEETMSRTLRIHVADLALEADLNDSPTAEAIWEALPLEGRANRWGEEIYFSIPVEMPTEPNAREVMQIGECAYWPGGKAFCIFFGPTPVSIEQEPRAYTAVNPFGLIQDGAALLAKVRDGEPIAIHAVEKPIA